jgi:hypothetical protein
MKKYPMHRVHYGFSVNVCNREKTYVEADKNTAIYYIPELNLVEVVTTIKGVVDVVWTSAYNIKYMIPKENCELEPVTAQKAKAGVREAQASLST